MESEKFKTSSKLRIAVISDIHISSDDPERNAVKTSEKLIECLKNEEFKYLILNGDLVHNGSNLEDFKLAKTFLNNTIKETDLDKRDVFYVAGNHDINLKELKNINRKYLSNDKGRSIYEKRNELLTLKKQGKRRKLNLEYFEPVFKNYIDLFKGNGFEPYRNLYTPPKSKKKHWLNYLCGYRILEEGIIIFSTNSSWFAEKGLLGKLTLGKEIVKKNIESIKKEKENIVLTCIHHDPIVDLDWESTVSNSRAYSTTYDDISEISSAIITSHRHILPSSLSYYQSKNLTLATGSIYDNKNHLNSFKILEIDLSSKQITVEDYVQNIKNDSEFHKIKPVLGEKEPKINSNYDSKVYPFSLKFNTKIDLNERLFWAKNKKEKKKFSKEYGKDDLNYIYTFLKEDICKKFDIESFLLKKKEVSNYFQLYQLGGIFILFVSVIENWEDSIEKIVLKYSRDFKHLYIYPYFLFEKRFLFKKQIIERVRKSLEKRKKEFPNYNNIYFFDVNFISYREIKKGKSKIILKKVKNHIESN